MNNQLLIITNNPSVNNIPNAVTEPVEGDSLKVLQQAYCRVAAGHALLSHPLAGGLQFWQNPFKSIVLCLEQSEADPMQLRIIEHCLLMVEEANGHDRIISGAGQDLQMLDSELLAQVLEQYKKAGEGYG